MSEVKIPHASTWIELDPPRRILHIVTKLSQTPGTPGFDATAQYEMTEAIGKTLRGIDGFDCYVIHSPDNPDGHR